MTSRRVLLHGGAPWGFRLRGGADVQQHIKITRVNLNSKAAKEGVREGDIVTSINGHSTKNCTNAEAHVLLKNAGDTLFLGLNEDVMATSKPKNSLDKINLQSEAANFEQSSLSSNASSEASQGLLHGDSKRKNLPTTQTEETKPNKTKRNTTKEELLKYFINFYPHSKYLDVIAEESSDISDIETLTKPIEDVCTSYVTAISNDPEISFVSDCSSSSNGSSKRNSSCDESETEDESEVCKEFFSVPSLKEFCIRFLLKHPFGREILEELAMVARNLQMRSENVDCSKYIDNLMDFLKSLSLYEEDIQEINSNDEHEILEKLQTIEKQLNNNDEDYIEQEIERLEEENEKLDAEINCMEISMNAFDDNNRIDAIDETVTKGAERLINAVSCILNTTQESIVAKSSCEMGNGVWSPGQNNSAPKDPPLKHTKSLKFADEPIPVVWTPRSAGSSPVCERKEFRPVNFESPVLQRKCRTDSESSSSGVQPPWKAADQSNVNDFKPKIPSSQSSPSVFQDTGLKLPRPQNPTVVLLQKAREGQIPKKTSYIINDEKINDTSAIMTSKVNEPKQEKYADVKDNVTIDRNVRKYDGIGPTSKDGMPLVLKSEVKESNQSKWYKQMYDTIHKQKPHRDEYVTVKYKQTKAPHSTGYLSEPELDSHRGYYTQDYNKYATLDRRRTLSTQNQNDFAPSTMPRISNTTRYVYTPPGSVKPPAQEYYSPPGRIEDYIPGHSSISDRETKEWWDAVMDIFNGWLDERSQTGYSYIEFISHLEKQRNIQPQNKGFMSQGLKESGYESDSTLIFKRREDPSMQLSPKEHKEVYKAIQKGGDVPFQGLRKPAPEKPKGVPQIEYFPLTPTLTRIRIHKNSNHDKSQSHSARKAPGTFFWQYKRSAPSTVKLTPEPPKRRSSKNNNTLRLISTLKIGSKPIPKRHETCFSSNLLEKNKVNCMREKLSCKLSPGAKKRGVKEVKAKCCSLKSLDKVCNKCSSIPVKTFGNVKEKVELTVRPIRSKLVKSPELTSPNEVKKVVAKQSKAMNSTYKVTHSLLSSVKNGTAGLLAGKEKTIPIKVGYSKEGNKLLKKPLKQKNPQRINKPVIKNQPKQTEIKKHKKDKLNVVISKKTNNQQPTTTTNQDTFSIFQDIKKQARIIHTDSFFQHLFLHNADVPQVKKCLTWIANKQRQVDNKKRILISDAAARLYLNLTKPVTRSKFRSLDEAVRSRSESPRRDFGLEVKVRSVSLPPQLKRSKIPLRVRVEKSLVGCVSPSGSLSSVCSFGTDYSDKFKELSQFYSILERYRKLEQSTSSTDLRPRLKSENEVIDFDRWREIRLRERAEIELKRLHEELEVKRKEKGFLFKTKEIRDFKWKKEFDRGLRLRDKSVENIKINFERLGRNKEQNLILYADTYKPKWRADSVRDLANKLTQNRSHSADRISRLNHRYITADQFLTHRIGSRIWSSLSIEQVDILKDQLNQIYNHSYTKPKLTYYIPEKQQIPPTTLKIRRNSDSSDCISTTNSNTLSEEDKKRISHSLSREVLDLISRNRKASRSLVFGKETRGAVAVIPTTTNNMEPQKALVTTDAVSPVKLSSASENESGSTDESSKTIVNADGIHKKVEYFEDIAKNDVYVPTVYKPSESAVESEMETQSLKSESDRIFFKLRSNSDDDLRGFYGENSRKSRENLYPSVSTSTESLYRCRSLSPYFGETYKLSKSGEVSKIKKQFEDTNRSKSEDNLDRKNSGDVNALRKTYEFPTGRGRCKSRRGGVVSPVFFRPEDRFMPHINIISKIATLCNKKPHEIARLYDRHKTNEELAKIFGCPVGEVTKLRQKFDSNEKISILGRMFTSSPDIQEIKAIAPYLAAEWTAHKYPYLNDNTRSVSSPEESVGSRDLSLVRRVPRPKSYSPPRPGRPKIIKNYQTEPNKFRSWWPPVPTRHKPTVTFKEPEAPPPPPKGHHGVKNYFDQDSSRKYVENEVTIHYKTPIRQEVKEALSEEELAEKQAEAMKKIYEEEKRRKYFQELHDMNSRRHTDNFVASQKSPIPLNRYDDFVDDLSPVVKQRPRSPEPRLVAKALYNFVGQSPKELSFRKGDIIYIKRQVDKNWFEGEHNAMVGLFPVNYVEVAPYDGVKITPRKSTEGQARAKYNFIAQTHLELSLAKGELVVITRRVDENWFEGRIGGRKGIFPVSYVEVLIDPSENAPNVTNTKPVASPAAHSLLLNGSSGGKESMGSNSYVPSFSRYQEKNYTPQASATYGSLKNPSVQELHVDTHTEAVPYRALYKYCPQNDDELELFEGDTVYVLEKCDDGWYVGSSNRTGAFGTFPGNYVQPV